MQQPNHPQPHPDHPQNLPPGPSPTSTPTTDAPQPPTYEFYQKQRQLFTKQNLNTLLAEEESFQESLFEDNRFTYTRESYSVAGVFEDRGGDRIGIVVKCFGKGSKGVQIYKGSVVAGTFDILSSGLSLHQLFQHMKIPSSIKLNIVNPSQKSQKTQTHPQKAPLFQNKPSQLFQNSLSLKSEQSSTTPTSTLSICYQANINKKVVPIELKLKLVLDPTLSQADSIKHFNELNSKLEKFRTDRKVEKIRMFYERMQQVYEEEILYLRGKLREKGGDGWEE